MVRVAGSHRTAGSLLAALAHCAKRGEIALARFAIAVVTIAFQQACGDGEPYRLWLLPA